ncbi:MAG: hypothetical protein KC466_04990 [Myxococcales bacterium]|nr:hypothetical protein [Myxococcales bacterium]
MMTRTAFGALALSIAVGIGGCTFARQRTNIEDPYGKIAQVQAGVTSTADLARIFGAGPTTVVDAPGGGALWIYAFGDAKTWQIGLIVFNVGKTNAAQDAAVFVVDGAGVVQEVHYGTNSKDLPWQFWPFGGNDD